MRGTYTIIISCNRPLKVTFGSLGTVKIPRGLYLYCGSALGKGAVSLEGRIRRHWRRNKKIRWHVDYMTSNRSCSVRAAIYVESTERLECNLNNALSKDLKALPVLPHLGASDCSCESHLMSIGGMNEETLVERIRTIYSKYGFPVHVIRTNQLRLVCPLPTF
jgi:Uri superfamily endonuclease